MKIYIDLFIKTTYFKISTQGTGKIKGHRKYVEEVFIIFYYL